jgi:hypothetical protein
MQSERGVADAIEYRPPKSMSRLSVGVALLLGAAAIVLLAIFLVGREAPAAFAAGLLGFLAITNGALVLHELRHRLVITPEIVRSVGVFATREVRLADVRRVEWKSFHPAASCGREPRSSNACPSHSA